MVETLPSPVTALAALADGRAGGRAGMRQAADRRQARRRCRPTIGCITALAFGADGTLWLANGSAEHAPSAWAADLMEKGASGSLWRREPRRARFRQSRRMASPSHSACSPDGDGVHRQRKLAAPAGRASTATGKRTISSRRICPAIPRGSSPAADGGAWLALFAPRNRLIEFVLQEDALSQRHDGRGAARPTGSRRRCPPAAASSSRCSAAASAPWASTSHGRRAAPTGWSCGSTPELQPQSSLHSRANGTRHGICSAVEHDGRLLVAVEGRRLPAGHRLAAAERH